MNPVINIADITAHINDYFINCGQNPEEWNIEDMAIAVRDYMYDHQLTTPNDIDEDDWSDFCIEYAY